MLYRIPDARKIDTEPVKSFFAKITAAEGKAEAIAVNLELGATPGDFECPLITDASKKKVGRKNEDAAEFLLNSILDKNNTLTLFNFDLQTQSFCGTKYKQNPVRITEKILSLELEKNSVQENLNLFLKDEPLTDDYKGCTSYPGTEAVKKTSIQSSQNYLLVQLKRFDQNLQKITKDITIDLVLTVSGVRWALEGVVLHTGTLTGGHYRYMWKNISGEWILFDDSTVSSLTKENRLTEQKQNGYILVYKKINATPMKTRKAIRFTKNTTGYNGVRATQKKKRGLRITTPPIKELIKTPVKTQKKKYGFKSFIKSLLTPKNKKVYESPLYKDDSLIKELVYNHLNKKQR